MRVTKIIREYVERTIREHYSDKMKEIKCTEPENLVAFRKWAEDYEAKILDDCCKKRDELGLELEGRYTFRNFEGTIKNNSKLTSVCAYLKNENKEEYQKKCDELKAAERKAIEDILIGLEIGDIDKKKLEEALAQFK